MKSRLRWAVLLVAALGALWIYQGMWAMLSYPKEAFSLVKELRTQFEEHWDRDTGITLGGRRLAHTRRGLWRQGSRIAIYGIEDVDTQNKIIAAVRLKVEELDLNRVIIEFHPLLRYNSSGNGSTMIQTDPLRTELIPGLQAEEPDTVNAHQWLARAVLVRSL